jgi:acetyl-CoA carboxylase alpha subunit
VVDAVVPEPPGGAHNDHDEAARLVAASLSEALRDVESLDPVERRRLRHRKFRDMGVFLE